MSFTGIGAEFKRLLSEVHKFEERAVQEVKDTAMYILEQLMSRTPVWEGTTVRNYNVATGGFSSAFSQPSGSGDPGPTNLLNLGSEPRRGVNQEAARSAAKSALTFEKLRDVYINNTSPHAELVDLGEAPGGPGQRIRNPGGVSTLAVASARAERRNWK